MKIWKMLGKSIIAMALVMLCFTVLSNRAEAASLAELQRKYPDGKYWNHYVNNINECGDLLDDYGNESFGGSVSSTPCAYHYAVSLESFVGTYDCNYFDGAWQCAGFARRMGYEAYGTKVTSWGTHTSVGSIKPGDVVKFVNGSTDQTHGHTVFVTAVSGTTITVGEANFIGDPCRIRWGGTYNLSGAWDIFIWSAPYALNTSTPSVPSDPWISWDHYADRHRVDSTNAVLAGWCNMDIDNSAVTQVGIYLYDYKGKQIANLTENVSFGGYTYFSLWYDVNGELGYTLSPGTPYKYKFLAEVYGKAYYSPVYDFTTTGPHTHQYDSGSVISQATCTSAGTRRYTCTTCGGTKDESISALGHSLSDSWTIGAYATCIEDGLKFKVCLRCNGNYKPTTIPATGHTYSVVEIREATCTRAGYTGYQCSSCGDTYTENISATGHRYGRVTTKSPTCTEKGYDTYYCSNCDYSYVSGEVPATGHNYQSVVTEPTCTEDGWITYTCSSCGDTYTESIPATGHSYKTTINAPTCTEYGFTYYVCSACQDSYIADKVPALGHSYTYSNTTDATHDLVCSACGETATEEHTYTDNKCLCGAEKKPEWTVSGFATTKTSSLVLEGEIFMNIFIKLEGIEGIDPEELVDRMGILTFYTKTPNLDDSNINTADLAKSKVKYDAETGYFIFETAGIPAKNMGDDWRYRCYIQMPDGSYVYSGRFIESPLRYCRTIVANTSKEMRALCTALMNYGAEAQKYFAQTSDYTYTTLMNEEFSKYQVLVRAYSATMITDRLTREKSYGYTYSNATFTGSTSNLVLAGAIDLNLFFSINHTDVTSAGILVWDQATYEAMDVFTIENATANITVLEEDIVKTDTTTQIKGVYAGTAAKDMGNTVFYAAYYTKADGTVIYSGVQRTSIETYANAVITGTYSARLKSTMKALVVYGDMAKDFWANRS